MAVEHNHTGGTEAASVAELVKSLHGPQVVPLGPAENGSAEVLAVPRGIEIQSIKKFLDEYLEAPERRKGTARFAAIDSFVAHVKRFADSDSVVFANPDPSQPSMTAVLDYNRAGADAPARFGEHRAVYTFPVSPEWVAWTKVSDQAMEQASFAAFIEDRISDLADPKAAQAGASAFAQSLGVELASPARVMELSRGLSVTVESKAGASVNLSTGEGQITFQEQHSDGAGQPIKVPGAFLIAIPVFRGDALYQIGVRLRYRVQGGKVTWRCVLYRTDRVFEDAIKFACESVAKATGLPVLMGSPE